MTVYKIYLLVIPRRSLDYFRLLYARLYETICCTRYTTFELSGREDSFVFGGLYQSLIFLRFAFCGLLFDVSANALSRFFVLIINLIPFYSIFFNSLETKWGRADFAERPCRRTYTQSVSRQRYVLWYRKTWGIFPIPKLPRLRLVQYLRTLTPLPLRPHFPIIVFSLSDETFEILL